MQAAARAAAAVSVAGGGSTSCTPSGSVRAVRARLPSFGTRLQAPRGREAAQVPRSARTSRSRDFACNRQPVSLDGCDVGTAPTCRPLSGPAPQRLSTWALGGSSEGGPHDPTGCSNQLVARRATRLPTCGAACRRRRRRCFIGKRVPPASAFPV